MTGAGVGERAVARVVHGKRHGGEGDLQLVVEHALGHLEGGARSHTGLEVGAQRVTHQRGLGQDLATVPG